MQRRSFLLGALAGVPAVALTPAEAAEPVSVLYAGSLLSLMEKGIGPAFDARGEGAFVGYAGGSGALANQIRDGLRRAEVFISASPKLNDTLGAGHGDRVRWYIEFARSPLMIGYDPRSRFAADLKARPWYEVLQQPGIRIGRTDPVLDPKGALTVQMLQRAEAAYRLPGLASRVLGAPDNPRQVRPEESLVGRLQSGQVDVGFFYATETADLHIPDIALPPDIVVAAHYTVTILRDAPNPAGAERFVAFLLGPAGRAIQLRHGLDMVGPTLTGDAAALPDLLRPFLAPGK
ncbi:extracellular solute-binding protein [Gluconacetobacter azotocaptans]|uniref:Extracellular solute-binding protein n=1 Tax=Gluconacetobacter azotocaptans TaxID=142834 RepID=A0A7W4PCG4_9PROT|nr:extracellular solute-binding protein [Gluconacetobacter azotocaptans]MBB2188668.1 extracellular solute-binding protein [Gluconacetobacter azotocaptans]GBQ35161.1 tungstate/molybdate binding protein [Gluconacetobacter azotocaptans DSM 13594]